MTRPFSRAVSAVNWREGNVSVFSTVFRDHEMPAGFGEIKGKAFRERRAWEHGAGRSLQEEMATHSSILVWRIPWTEGPGGLQFTGCKEPDTTEQLTLT